MITAETETTASAPTNKRRPAATRGSICAGLRRVALGAGAGRATGGG